MTTRQNSKITINMLNLFDLYWKLHIRWT